MKKWIYYCILAVILNLTCERAGWHAYDMATHTIRGTVVMLVSFLLITVGDAIWDNIPRLAKYEYETWEEEFGWMMQESKR